MRKFQYWLVAVALLIILVIWSFLFYDDIRSQNHAVKTLIKPSVVHLAKYPNLIASPQIKAYVHELGVFKGFDRVTSFRAHDVNGVHMISAVVKLKYNHGLGYFDVQYKELNGKWIMTELKVFSPKH